jgi:hypothetical protein
MNRIRAHRAITCTVLLHAALAWRAGAQAPERAALVATLGTDTIAIDRFTRTRDRLEGDLLIRSPRTQLIRYTAALDAAGTITRLDASVRQADGSELQNIVMDFTGDSITTVITGRQAASARAPRTAGAVPLPALPNSFYALGFFEHAVRQGVATGVSSFDVPWIVVGGRGAFPTTVKRLGGDTIEIGFFAGPMLARTDAAGRLLWLSGRNSTVKIEVERVADIAIEPLAADFGARDAAGRGLGIVSPLDSVVTSTGGAQIRVRYSRPSRRGREIFGGVVPWNEVWRAGANAATSLVTDRDLDFGGATVPAGAYTLYVLPGPERSELIISTQTGQWGTVYESGRDLVRIPMQVERTNDVVEMFTIAIASREGGGQLSLAWDRTRFSVPFTVR